MQSKPTVNPVHKSAPRHPAGRADFSLNSILTAAGETAYYWDLDSDQMVWAPNALQIFSIEDPAALRTGDNFEKLRRESSAKTSRYEAMIAATSKSDRDGNLFTLQYAVDGDGEEEDVWLEDHGRWTPGPDGRPSVVRGVVRIINERYIREQKLNFLSRHDHLTGQINRAELWESISDALLSSRDKNAHSRNQEQISGQGGGANGSYALLLVGINKLLTINEAFGFDTGDEIIAAVAKRLKSQLRDDDKLGRFSSNKFGILLSESSGVAMEAIAERLLRAVRDNVFETSLGPVAVTISIGGVQLSDGTITVSEAIGHCLEALARAKARPHDMFVACQHASDKKKDRQRNGEIADELVEAIRDHRLVLALQPIVRADNLEPVIHECLLRIRTRDGGIISGGEFIPVAERLGLIRLVDYRVLELAIDLARHRPELSLTINVSGLTTGDPNWLALLASLTNGDMDLTSRLIVEITETAAIQDIEESCNFVRQVKQLGCRVAMDDFGTGYNSFRNLQMLGLDMVKIDGAFVENMRENRDDQLFVKILSDLARQFDLEIVAECVTDDDTAQLARELGITYLQGYHLGKPALALPEDYRSGEMA